MSPSAMHFAQLVFFAASGAMVVLADGHWQQIFNSESHHQNETLGSTSSSSSDVVVEDTAGVAHYVTMAAAFLIVAIPAIFVFGAVMTWFGRKQQHLKRARLVHSHILSKQLAKDFELNNTVADSPIDDSDDETYGAAFQKRLREIEAQEASATDLEAPTTLPFNRQKWLLSNAHYSKMGKPFPTDTQVKTDNKIGKIYFPRGPIEQAAKLFRGSLPSVPAKPNSTDTNSDAGTSASSTHRQAVAVAVADEPSTEQCPRSNTPGTLRDVTARATGPEDHSNGPRQHGPYPFTRICGTYASPGGSYQSDCMDSDSNSLQQSRKARQQILSV